MKKVIYITALLIGATTMAQTITVNGTPMLVSDDISFPFWLESGSSISPEVPVSSISVLEFNIVPNNNGNDMVFNQVISVTEGQTVPEGKTWKVESILIENQGFDSENTNASTFIPIHSSYTNISMPTPEYDSVNICYPIHATILPSGGSSITERGFCFSSINEEPTVYDNLINSGSGKGAFHEILYNGDDIEINTTYYIRAYATSLEGIVYSEVHTFTTNSVIFPTIGESYQDGIIFYLNESGHSGLLVSEDLGNVPWGCGGSNISLTTWENGIIGQAEILSQCSDRPIAASVVANLEPFNSIEWYIPSQNQLIEIYNSIGNGGTQGDIGGFGDDFYWTFTQGNSNCAWGINFSNGNESCENKSLFHKIRAVRSF